MNPDKATVELVAKAIHEAIFKELGCLEENKWEDLPEWERQEYMDIHAQAAIAALPTPTDASGLVEALEKMAVDEPLCDDYHCGSCGCHLRLAKQALALYREGNQWSDEVPTVPGWIALEERRPPLHKTRKDTSEAVLVCWEGSTKPHGRVAVYEETRIWGEEDFGAGFSCYYTGRPLTDKINFWMPTPHGPLQPPADKEG